MGEGRRVLGVLGRLRGIEGGVGEIERGWGVLGG